MKTEVGRNHDPSGADRSGLRPDLRAQDQQQSEETPRESPLLPGEDIAEALERRGDALSVRAARHIRIKWNTEDGLRQQLRREVERLNASPDSPQKAGANPNDAFRWICIHCDTVSGIDDRICLGCKKPRYPRIDAQNGNEVQK